MAFRMQGTMDAEQMFHQDLESAVKSVKFLGSKQSINKWFIVAGNVHGDIYTFKYDKKKGISKNKWHMDDGESISCMAGTQDASIILAATDRGTIGRIHLNGSDVNNHTLDISHGLGTTANSIHFFPDHTNEKAIIGTRTGEIAIFNVERNEIENILPTAHRRNSLTEALPLSSSIVLTASTDNTARILDLRAPTTEVVRMKHDSWVYCASAASADSKQVLTGSREGVLYLWDIRSPSHPDPRAKAVFRRGVTTCVLNDVQNIAVVGSSDHTAQVWDLTSETLRFDLKGFQNGVKCLSLSKNRQLIAGSGFDGFVRLYDIGFPVRRDVSLLTRAKHLPGDLDSTITEFLW